MEFPSRDGAVLTHAAGHFNHARGAEVRPCEFLLAGPDQLYRLTGCLRQARGFDGVFARMLAAICRSGIRNDRAYVPFGNAERGCQLLADSERTLRSGPHGKLW